MFSVVSRIENQVRGEDRVVVRQDGDRLLVVVADGAGGTGGGREAAQAVCDAVVAAASGSNAWVDILREVDSTLMHAARGGLSTGVVVEVIGRTMRGASVGDSAAWSISDGWADDLTTRQRRKPLLGTGQAHPVAFGPVPLRDRLLVASDGLMKYGRRSEIQRRAMLLSLDAGLEALFDLVRLPRGGFQDDVSIVLAAVATT